MQKLKSFSVSARLFQISFGLLLSFGGLLLSETAGASQDFFVSRQVYLAPNELHPIDMLPALKGLQPGALISVGTERGLMTMILDHEATSLVQVDNSRATVLFNKINLELLTAAHDRADYLHLRFWADQREWIRRAPKLSSSMASAENFAWWRHNFIKDDYGWRDFHYEIIHQRKPVLRQSERAPFESANYLVDEKAFQRLHQIVKEGRIEVRLLDLTDIPKVTLFLQERARQGPIRGLDVSNAWWTNFAGPGPVYQVSQILKDVDPKAALLLTNRGKGSVLNWIYESYNTADPRLAELLMDEDWDLDPADAAFANPCDALLRKR